MKRAIEVAEIRKGDLIRWEREREFSPRAIEYHAGHDKHQWSTRPGQHYLLDRPEPAVELPTEPTLGWLTRYIGEESSGLGRYKTLLGRFSASEYHLESADESDSDGAHFDIHPNITAFTPATAVPAEAIEKMRRVAATCDATYPDYKEAVFAFLAAVDAATEATS